MSADLYIHIRTENITDEILRDFNSYNGSFETGKIISDSPSIWIGSVSWLKASLLGDWDTFVPDTVQEIHDLIGENLPVLDEDLKIKILNCFDPENKTDYKLADKEEVEQLLNQHMGEQLFTVSW